MKSLPFVTTILWITTLVGYQFLPSVFRQEYFQYPLILLLSILLPVSFWMVANGKKKYFSIFFLAIFLFNISFFVFALKTNYAVKSTLSTQLQAGMNPKLAELLVTEASVEKRKVIARIIYQRHAIALPYKNEQEGYTLYSPNKEDLNNHLENRIRQADLTMQDRELSFNLITTGFLLTVHVFLFITLVIFLILYDKKKPVIIP